MNKIDAKGLACPQPVLLLKNALKTKENEYEIVVDNMTAKENVSRFAQNSGYNVEVNDLGHEEILIKVNKK